MHGVDDERDAELVDVVGLVVRVVWQIHVVLGAEILVDVVGVFPASVIKDEAGREVSLTVYGGQF